MKFATFNVLHGRPIVNGRPLPVQAGGEPFTEAVASLDADVLALQELDHLQERSGGVDQALVAASASGAKDWRYAAALHGRWAPDTGWTCDRAEPGMRVHGPHEAVDGGAVPSHGIALLTRLPVRAWGARRLAPAPWRVPIRVAGRPGLTMAADQARVALAAVLEGDRGPFTVVAVHLSFVPGWNIGQLGAVRRWIADLPRPCLLLGDFNMIGAVPRITLGGAGAMDGVIRRERPQSGWRNLARTPTYPSHRPVVQFDHVLANGISRESVRAVSTPLMPISDHRPVVVELSL